ncbi:DNA gyrase subunit A [Stomatohabitans albus]|uniref:DNA gyrase subunit A n=1 Tax=Stomatohabitans albus TaxID=3110766 RepID=UPI00300CCDC6
MSTETTPAEFEEHFEPIGIESELKKSYIDYAMSVIVGRALPESRDGLKPVHRRILYGMYEGGMRAGTQHKKSAAAVGDVMKNYHPHGDGAIYDALVRMAQPWAMRYPLIDGHGNFGSVDGDPPAAMRYTEARLSRLAMELLRDIDEDTVEWTDSYDGSTTEPSVLPSRFPNLLVNGSDGIAVGMATKMAPHNLREITNAVCATIDNPDIELEELLTLVPGPDFPTGALIMGTGGIRDAYATGRGSVRMRARVEVEETTTGGERLVATELPYQVNKANLASKIADLVNNKEIEGIRDIRDESNRDGTRLVIELKRDANAQVVLNQLFKRTQLQDSFGINNVCLVNGVPRTLGLKPQIVHYIDHQVEIITRRTHYRLRKASERAHVLEGYLIALDNIDAIIDLIRNSESADAALLALQKRFGLTEVQSRAILDMQFRRLAALERLKIQEEFNELQAIIDDLKDILADESRVRAIIKDELQEISNKFGDARRSEILPGEGDLNDEDLIPREEVVVTVTEDGYIKRVAAAEYRTQKRGGRGVNSGNLKDQDVIRDLFTASSHDWILFFTSKGKVHRLKAYQIPAKSRTARGVYIANVPGLVLETDETLRTVIGVPDLSAEGVNVVFVTKLGRVKRTALTEYDSPRTSLIAINLNDGDELIDARLTHGDDDIILVTAKGQSIRFHEQDVRLMGRAAAGVKGMTLSAGDEVLSAAICEEDGYLVIVTDGGYGKRTPLENYPVQKRGGKGVLTAKLTETRGRLVAGLVAQFTQEIYIVTDRGTIIRMDVRDVRPTGRNTQGVMVMRLAEGESVASVAKVRGEDGLDEDGFGEDIDQGDSPANNENGAKVIEAPDPDDQPTE